MLSIKNIEITLFLINLQITRKNVDLNFKYNMISLKNLLFFHVVIVV